MQRPVLVGEYELTLDAKNRVAVPARLRSAFVDGIYLTKEPEPCLGGWNPEEFGNRLEEDTAATDPGSAAGVTHDVTVIGAQDHLEIWDRAVWARYLARLEEEADVTAAEHAT
jgi:MraZ protein